MGINKGFCKKHKKFFGIITISEKGQIAIPIELRQELSLKSGDKLIVIKRKDGHGINLIKEQEIEKFLEKVSD